MEERRGRRHRADRHGLHRREQREYGGRRHGGSWRHREIHEGEGLGAAEDQYEIKVWFPEFNTLLNFMRWEDYDTVIRSRRIDEIRDDIIARRRVWTFHQVEQELQRIALEGRRAARAATAASVGEQGQVRALMARIDQQQQTINHLVTVTTNLARLENDRQVEGAAGEEAPAA